MYYSNNLSAVEISKKFNCNSTLIYNILKGKTYINETFKYIEYYKNYKYRSKKEIGVYDRKISGLNNYQNRISENQIIEIFNMYHILNKSSLKIAKEYHVSKKMILKMLNGKSYKDITLPLIEKYGTIRK
ncbi:MAG: hypothetical protein LC122_13465 [Chitinophagales bacterium]|nr:hypothetical protein [Chitinophagales bacterium]